MTEESQFDSWQGQETFLLSSDQTGSGANPASCSVEISFFGGWEGMVRAWSWPLTLV